MTIYMHYLRNIYRDFLGRCRVKQLEFRTSPTACPKSYVQIGKWSNLTLMCTKSSLDYLRVKKLGGKHMQHCFDACRYYVENVGNHWHPARVASAPAEFADR